MTLLLVHLASLLICTWFYLALVFVGIGLVVMRPLKWRVLSINHLFTLFWIGWACSLFLLQLWHLVFPVDWRATLLISLAGVGGLIWNGNDISTLIKGKWKEMAAVGLFVLFISFLIANRAILPPLHYDTGLYHLQSVRWISTYPIVKGLGNLHGRLAFNCSYFLFPAMIEIGFWSSRSHHVANGLLMTIFYAQVVYSLFILLTRKDCVSSYHIFYVFFSIPTLFIDNLSSPAPDLPVYILQVILSAHFWEFLNKFHKSAEGCVRRLFIIATLVTAGITIKLNFLVFGMSIMMISLYLGVFSPRAPVGIRKKRIVLFIFMIAAAGLIPWMVRGVILSGYIAYPASFGGFPVDWRIPEASITNMRNWTYSWSRMPKTHWSLVLNNWAWFLPWMVRMSRILYVTTPVCMAGIFAVILFWVRFVFKGIKSRPLSYVFIIPGMLYILYWFFTAPDPRLVSAGFWIMGIGWGMILIHLAVENKKKWIAGAVILIYLFLCQNFFIYQKDALGSTLKQTKNIFKALSEIRFYPVVLIAPNLPGGFYPIPRVEVESFKTQSGLILNVPVKGDQCWDAPLPCTVYPHPHLKLRKAGDMRYGFMIDPRDETDVTVGMHDRWHKR